eukprot:518814_1
MMEYIGIEDLKMILAKYYDDRDKDGDYQSPRSSVADMDTNNPVLVKNTVSIGDAGGETVHVEMVETIGIRVADGPQNRANSISSPRNLDETLIPHSDPQNEQPLKDNSTREDPSENKHKNDEEPTATETELVSITMSNTKQQKLIDLYATNRDLWRKKIVTAIREYPHQFNIILEILKTSNNDDGDGNASLSMKEFETAFPSLNNSLIECMFRDIASFDHKDKDEAVMSDKKLKITTILRWMNSRSHMHIFDEVEVVNDK